MRTRINNITFTPGTRSITTGITDLTIDDIRLFINESQMKVICSSMQKGNIDSISSGVVTYKDTFPVLVLGDHITFEIDKGDDVAKKSDIPTVQQIQNGLATETSVKDGNDTSIALLKGLNGIAGDITAGKAAIKAAVETKGVVSTATTLTGLASEVAQIIQQPYAIQGGALYETQIFGAPTDRQNLYQQLGSPLWNLYQVLADLLSDGTLVRYDEGHVGEPFGGIMLAEYFKGYDTISLQNCPLGGMYVTCDGHRYTSDATHTWEDEDNGKCNRWVAYCFAEENTNYTIPSTALCPCSIFIGRRVGTITCSVAGRLRELVIIDGTEQAPNYLEGTNFGSTQVWQQEVTLRNLTHSAGRLFRQNGNVVSIVLENVTITQPIIYGNCSNLTSIYIGKNCTISQSTVDNNKIRVLTEDVGWSYDSYPPPIAYIYIEDGLSWGSIGLIVGGVGNQMSTSHLFDMLTIDGVRTLRSPILSEQKNLHCLCYKTLYMDTVEHFNSSFCTQRGGNGVYWTHMEVISAKSADNFWLDGSMRNLINLIDIIVGPVASNMNLSMWSATNVIADATKLATCNANIRNHIAANIQDRSETTPLTVTFSQALRNALETATEDAFTAKNWNIAPARSN